MRVRQGMRALAGMQRDEKLRHLDAPSPSHVPLMAVDALA